MAAPGKAERPPRKKVWHDDEPGDRHFVTFCCYGRMPLLSKERTTAMSTQWPR